MIRAIERRIKFNSTSEITKQRHLNRIIKMLDKLNIRFHLTNPNQVKLKHIKWLLEVYLKEHANSTQADYKRSIRILIKAMGRDQWLGHLGLSAHQKNGGRPSKIRIAHARNRH